MEKAASEAERRLAEIRDQLEHHAVYQKWVFVDAVAYLLSQVKEPPIKLSNWEWGRISVYLHRALLEQEEPMERDLELLHKLGVAGIGGEDGARS
jgi:hypothetical protein